MPIDLEQIAPRTEPFRSQVCVVGAGIAGLTLAHRLAKQGIDVALLEAGGLELEAHGQALLAAAHRTGTPHAGTHEGRFRAYGGASLRWGGQLLPLPAALTDERWPITAAELKPHEAEALLGIDQLPYDATAFFTATSFTAPSLSVQLRDLTPRLSKWAPFARRNMAETVGRELLASAQVTVYLHAQASELVLAKSGTHLEAVLVRTLAGSIFRFEARHFVLAAGTVETVRLLLASRGVAPGGIGNDHDQLGRNFHDHLTLPAATLTGAARKVFVSQLRPWLTGGSDTRATLHSAKFEASAELCQRLKLNPVLLHMTLAEPTDSGLAVVRNLLTARQQGKMLSTLAASAPKLPAAALEAARLAWEAKVHHRRFVSAATTASLQFNVAQDSPSQSRITLGEDLDPYGLPQPIVDWRISPNEFATFRTFASYLRERLADLEGVHWTPELFNPDTPLPTLGDARHAMGGATMGADPRTSVVDRDLTLHGVPNLHIASAATFPTGLPQLATLTLMSLALRLADRLAANAR